MAKKPVIRYGSSNPYINLYPSDFRDLVKIGASLFIQTTWGEDIKGTIREQGDSYKITLVRGSDVIAEEMEKTEAITVFTGKAFNVRKISPPFDLRNKISFSLNMNRERRMNSLDDLWDLYKEQIVIHDEALINNKVDNDKAYIPIRFDFGKFHVVVISDGFGQFNLSEGYYCMEGFPTTDEAIEILSNIPAKYVDMRRIDWMKAVIKKFADDAEEGRAQRERERERREER